jgi:hypothetical protein
VVISANGQILIGPKAGVQFGWVSFENEGQEAGDLADADFLKSTPALGVHAGVTAIFKVKERFFLDAELLYVLRQQVIKGRLDPLLKNTMNSHYVELPITFRMNFDGNIGNLKFQYFLGAGPNVSYWLFSTGKLESSELDEIDLPALKYKTSFKAYEDGDRADRLYIEDANRIQLGVHFLTGLMMNPAPGHAFKLDLRFDYGHSYFASSDYGIYPDLIDYAEPLKARYSAIKIGLAYVFDTKVAERKKGKSTAKIRKGR